MAKGQEAKQIEYLNSFAKTYGYVKYFHPSDEAASIDWNAFAIYGANKVLACETQEDLVGTLKSLFEPIAPTVQFFNTSKSPFNGEDQVVDASCDITYWQHFGLGKDAKSGGDIYKSSRVNSLTTVDKASDFGNIVSSFDLKEYRNSEIKFTAWAKLAPGSQGNARLWFRVDNSDGSYGFFDNMGDRPITANEWQQYEIIGTVDEKGGKLIFGSFLIGKGTAFLDGFKMSYRKQGSDAWTPIDLFNGSFEASDLKAKKEGAINSFNGVGKGYTFNLITDDVKDGKQAVQINYLGEMATVSGSQLFDAAPKRGSEIEEAIGKNLYVRVPLTACLDEDKATVPKANQDKFKAINEALEGVKIDPNELDTRVGNVVIVYNVFQHFYPYFDAIDVNWNEQFKKAIAKSFLDTSSIDHLNTLQQLTFSLKDGHIRVSGPKNIKTHIPGFTWEIIQGKLVISQVIDSQLNLKVGDVVKRINGTTAKDYLEKTYKTISAGNQGWMNYRARTESLSGPKGSIMNLVISGKNVSATRDLAMNENWKYVYPKKVSHKALSDDIYYVNLDNTKMDTINTLMPVLEQSKGLIFDLRGYPDGNHELISHLLKQRDTVQNWMRIPKIIYPDQKNYAGFRESGWQMQTKKPYLGDKKVVFLIDGSAISYAESYMGFIKGYKLATIVGQPTAGANGNVNRFTLPGGYSISFTGMKVLKHNGSQHHTIGVLPDVYVEKTIAGLVENRDEFLEKAIQIIKKQ